VVLPDLEGAAARLGPTVARIRLRQVVAELAAAPVDSTFEWQSRPR